jgi:hypothetical protein
MKEKKELESYQIRVKGESLTDWSGAVPESIDKLIKKPDKDWLSLFFKIASTQIEMHCQAGRTDEAMTVLEKYREQQFEYSNPLNTFKKDQQNGGYPYQGAHCFLGAIRDSAADMGIFYKKKGDILPSDKHFRKYVRVMPSHINLYRDGKIITKPDEIEGQQPVEDVKGFARYEVIRHPFTFSFNIQILVGGKFKDFLADQEKVIKTIYNSAFNGQGARRAAGYGGWKVVDAKVEDWSNLR